MPMTAYGLGSVEQADVTDGAEVESSDEADEILEGEVLDVGHTEPRRSRTSPQRSIILSVLSVTRRTWPARS